MKTNCTTQSPDALRIYLGPEALATHTPHVSQCSTYPRFPASPTFQPHCPRMRLPSSSTVCVLFATAALCRGSRDHKTDPSKASAAHGVQYQTGFGAPSCAGRARHQACERARRVVQRTLPAMKCSTSTTKATWLWLVRPPVTCSIWLSCCSTVECCWSLTELSAHGPAGLIPVGFLSGEVQLSLCFIAMHRP